MARYLTPYKITLLALVSVYTESVVPANATVPILSFLVSQLLPVSPDPEDGGFRPSDSNTEVTLDVFYDTTASHASGIPGRTVWDLLLNKLWKIDSLDALHVFFEGLSLLLPKSTERIDEAPFHDKAPHRIQLSKDSPLGIFVRRARLEFTRLHFHDVVALWQSFAGFRLPTLQQWRKRNPRSSFTGLDINLDDHSLGSHSLPAPLAQGFTLGQGTSKIAFSTDDVERLLEHQVNQIQRVGTRLPKESILHLRTMLQAGISTPSLSYYVQFLEAWKMGDYPSSFDNLHRYFDYTMHNRERMFYQYALLNLAALHADFGALTEAMAAIQETISTAREHNDMGCLNYSLSWLYHFGKVNSKGLKNVQAKGVIGTDKEALNFLKVRSKEAQMWCIFSTSLLGEARLSMVHGDSPSQTFESLLKTSHVNLIHNLSNTTGSHMSLVSAVYGRLGVSSQSWLTEQIFLHCYNPRSPAEDRIQSISRGAILLAQKGRYLEALRYMDQVDEPTLRTLKYQRFWTVQTGVLRMKQRLHCNDLDAATQILHQLKAVTASGHDQSNAITFLEIDLNVRRKDYSKALVLLEGLADGLDEGTFDVYQHIKTMSVKAQIYDKAGIPQKGFSVALRAATLAYTAKIFPALWEAIGALCAILHSLKEFEGSIQLLDSMMPQVLECDDCHLAARSYSLLADAHVGQAGKVRARTIQCKEQLSKGLESLDRAFDEYSRLGDVNGQCEMLAKKATIMHLNGDPVLANDCAAQYLAIKSTARENR